MTDTAANNTQPDLLSLMQLADAGDAEAQYQCGRCYAQGLGVSVNYRRAGHYWLEASKQNHPSAQMYLGTLFEKGLGVAQDSEKAGQCYQKAANQDLAEAKVRLAMLHMQGQGVAKDHKKAILLFIQAANQGNPIAQYNLGIAYDKGLGGLTQNSEQALFWYQQAANQHHAQALQKIQESRFSTTHTAEPTAQTTTDISPADEAETLYQQGVRLMGQVLSQAMTAFSQAADRGHVKAQYNLGLASLYGVGGVAIDIDKAVMWLKQSAENGFRPAYFVLGWLYQGGYHTWRHALALPQHPSEPPTDDEDDEINDKFATDSALAIGYYEMAGELGHAQAQYFLAKIYENGNGVKSDSDISLAWLRQAAKQGHNIAYAELEKRFS